MATQVAELERQLHAAEAEQADWSLIARALGRDGVQALLIDAAGGELTELVNDLLRSCFGSSRYTMEVRTTRPKKKEKGEKEVLDFLVYDNEQPQDPPRDAREYSDGQMAILREAIALAFALLSRRRLGIQITPVRDETGANLSPANAIAYVRMLRRFAEIAGCDKLLFVSHSETVQALADCRVTVANGR